MRRDNLCRSAGDFVDEAKKGGFVGKEGSDAGSAFDFLVEAFERVGGSQAALRGDWQREDGEAVGKVLLHPGGAFGGGFEFD